MSELTNILIRLDEWDYQCTVGSVQGVPGDRHPCRDVI